MAVSADPLPRKGKCFFEIVLESTNCDPSGQIAYPESCIVGITTGYMHSDDSGPLLGSTKDSWGFRIDGKKIHDGSCEKYAPHFTNVSKVPKQVKFIIRVHVNCDSGTLVFCDNDNNRGIAFEIPKKHFGFMSSLYAAASFSSCSHFASFVD